LRLGWPDIRWERRAGCAAAGTLPAASRARAGPACAAAAPDAARCVVLARACGRRLCARRPRSLGTRGRAAVLERPSLELKCA
jgi:hypothetical protein